MFITCLLIYVFLDLRCPGNMYHSRTRAQFLRFSITSHFNNFHVFLLPKMFRKPIRNEAPAIQKSMSKTMLFSISFLWAFGFHFGRSWPSKWGSWASKWESTWPFWYPRTLPEASTIHSFGRDASQEAPKGFPRAPQARFWSSWGLIFKLPGSILVPQGLDFKIILEPQDAERRTCTS